MSEVNAEFAYGIRKFDGREYGTWKFRIKKTLKHHKCEIALTEDKPDETNIDAYNEWESKDATAQAIIVACIQDSHISYIQDDTLTTAKSMIIKLDSIFEKKSTCSRIYYQMKLFNMKMINGQTMQDLFLEFDDIIRQLRQLGAEIDEITQICHIFMMLPSKFDNVRTVLETLPEERLTMSFVRARLLEEELRLDHDVNTFQDADYSAFETERYWTSHQKKRSVAKSQSNDGRTSSSESRSCFICGKIGHLANRCYQKKRYKRTSSNAEVEMNEEEESNVLGFCVQSMSTSSDQVQHNEKEEIEYELCMPEEIVCTADTISYNLLPDTSREKYMKIYNAFQAWKEKKNSTSFCENVFLAYFEDLSLKHAPNTMWSYYSMLKATVNLCHNIDISKYSKLIQFIKRKNEKYEPKKTKVFESEEIKKFLDKADNNQWLAIKVAAVIGILGGLRSEEFPRILVSDICEKDDVLIVHISRRKTKKPTDIIIQKEYRTLVNQYRYLRPPNVETDRFFLTYRNGQCIRMPIGVNQFYKMPTLIAKYLKLNDPESYTGHTFRRSGASLLANAEEDIDRLKSWGKWKSYNVPKEYVENSLKYKRATADMIVSLIDDPNPVVKALNEPSALRLVS